MLQEKLEAPWLAAFAGSMQVTSAAGTDLRIALEGAIRGGNRGYPARPGRVNHWRNRTVALDGQAVFDAGRVA